MAQSITIKMDTSRYVSPDEEDVAEAKSYARKRNDAIVALLATIKRLMDDATKRLVETCYRSNMEATEFNVDDIEDELHEDINEIMDALQEEITIAINGAILDIPLLDSSTTQNYLSMLTSYLMSLGHGERNFNETLYNYLWRYLRDIEAYVAVTKYAELPLAEALPKILGSIGQKGAPTLQQELNTAYANANDFSAAYINSRGEVFDYDGTPNVSGIPRDGMMAVLNTTNIAMSMLYGKAQLWDFEQRGAVGYYQLRGSAYPCAICDEEVGFYEGDIFNAPPLPHPHCMCYRIPIYNSTAYRPVDMSML